MVGMPNGTTQGQSLSLKSKPHKAMNDSTFCIAAYILRKDPERFDRLDGVWTVAKQYYNSYLNSKYNDISRSELDCVNDFMDARYPKN